MLERIHSGRTGEFRRVLRACAIAASHGRHAVALLVPAEQDPDGFMRAFYRHCREKAGRPVRLLTLDPGPSSPVGIQQLASLAGVDPREVTGNVSRLTDLLGAPERLFERLRVALASDLATDDAATGPGLMLVEGDIRRERTLLAFLGHLCPTLSRWRAIPAIRPRVDQFVIVVTVPVGPDGSIPAQLPDEVERIAIRPIDAEDLRQAADAATEILLRGLSGQSCTAPRAADAAGPADMGSRATWLLSVANRSRAPARALSEAVRLLASTGSLSVEAFRAAIDASVDSGAFLEAGELADLSCAPADLHGRITALVVAGRASEALSVFESSPDADAGFRVDVAGLALAIGDLAAADRLLGHPDTDSRNSCPGATLLVAELAFERSDYDAAFRLAHAAFEQPIPDDIRAEASNLLGKIRLRQGRHDEAERWFLEGAEAGSGGSGSERARAVHNLGLVALRRDRLDLAVRRLQEAVVLSDEAGEAYGAALARYNLGIVLEFQGRYQAAFEYIVEAIDRLSYLGRVVQLPVALLSLADLLITFGEWDRAMALIGLAEEQARKVGPEHGAALCAMKRGECRLGQGDAAASLPLLLSAFQAFDAAARSDDSAFCAARIAEAALASGDVGLARSWAERAASRVENSTREARGRGLLVQGRLALASACPGQALCPLADAREILARSDQREPLALSCMALAEAHEALGHPDVAGALREEAASLVERIAAEIPSAHRKAYLAKPVIAAILTAARTEKREEVPPPIAMVRNVTPLVARPRMRRMLPRIIGESPALQRVLVAIERVREVQTPVLLLGESGTGKELLAEAIHLLSPRAEGPFVRVNAAAFTDTLLLSELFGHEKGAFTGAHSRRIGRFEAAHGGTLFLDEIGDVSERLQTALLRVIEEQRFQRVGGTETVHVDVRIVFATNRDLHALMKQGRFRQDLYHRISGISLSVPPLRERPEDIPSLVTAFLQEIGRDTGRSFVTSNDAMKLLTAWSWPGNIRELKNVLRKTCLMSDGEVITAEAILRENPELRQARGRPVEGRLDAFDLVFGRGLSLFDARREMEVALIREALVQSGGNISAAAQLLGMKRPRLSQMVKEYGLKVQGVDATLDSAKEAP